MSTKFSRYNSSKSHYSSDDDMSGFSPISIAEVSPSPVIIGQSATILMDDSIDDISAKIGVSASSNTHTMKNRRKRNGGRDNRTTKRHSEHDHGRDSYSMGTIDSNHENSTPPITIENGNNGSNNTRNYHYISKNGNKK